MMTVDDLRVVMGDLATSTKRYIAAEITGVLEGVGEKLAALEAKLAAVQLTPGPMGPAGEPGARGADGAPGRDGVDGHHGEKGADGLPGRDGSDGRPGEKGADGLPGRDGNSLDLDWLHKSLSATLVHGRDGRDGADGTPGEKGADGAPGRDGASVTLDDLRPLVLELVQAAWAALPPPRDGRDGAPGEKGLDGRDGAAGKDGRDGAPGVPGPMGEKGLDGKDGLNGKDGADGLRGKDGTTFDSFDFWHDDESGVRLQLKQGEQTVEHAIPTMWDAGVWRPVRRYTKGATVSWNGSLWIAQIHTSGEKPADGSGAWRLAVKAGRDAKPPREGS